MNRFFAYFTPKTCAQTAVGMAVCIVLITILELVFQTLFFPHQWPLHLIGLHSFFVGGPFVILFYMIGTQQLKLLRQLSLKSRKDGLTGLNNRHTFLDLAQRRLDEQPNGVILLIDADHFKAVNDTYGHAVGDTCLVAIANHLRWNLRPEDVAGRIGGEEFAVLVAGVTLAQGRAIGERMTRPIPYSGGADHPHLSITLSVGAAAATPDVSLDRLLIRADEALYMAKGAGRACLKAWRDQSAHVAA